MVHLQKKKNYFYKKQWISKPDFITSCRPVCHFSRPNSNWLAKEYVYCKAMLSALRVRSIGEEGFQCNGKRVPSNEEISWSCAVYLLPGKENHWVILAKSARSMTMWLAVPIKSHEESPKKGERNS